MKRNATTCILVAALCALVGIVAWVEYGGGRHHDRGGDATDVDARCSSGGRPSSVEVCSVDETAKAPVSAGNGSRGGGETRRIEGEDLVDAFDSLTDKWMKPAKGGVTMADVDAFAAQFGRVPKTRKAECLQRALNLVPDENVMLLAGILMDKSQERELLDLIYHDVLNRPEDVKKPILKQIFKDREHPCWSDAAWILEATGGRPNKK